MQEVTIKALLLVIIGINVYAEMMISTRLALTRVLCLQVFRPRTPPEAIALCSRLLEYTPTARLTPLEACAHSFFDELRDPNIKLPNGREKPSLFNFTTQGLD